MSSQGFHNTKIVPFPKGHRHHDTYVGIISSSPGESRAHENGFAGQIDESVDLEEGSGSKEKQKTPYRNINSPEYRAAADKQKEKMKKDDAATPGKNLLNRLKDNQHELDKNHNGKIDAHDFKLLRDKKNESVESIDELSKGTLMSYIKKADKQQGKNFDDIVAANKDNDRRKANMANAKYINRERGQDRAVSKMYAKYDNPKTKRVLQFEGLDEKINPKKKTTDTLAGRTKGGDDNQHTSYKVALGDENVQVPTSRAKSLAIEAYRKIRRESMMGQTGTSEEKKK